jgi:hypothetical protein
MNASMGHVWNDTGGGGAQSTRNKTCPSASTSYVDWPGIEPDPPR